MKPMRRASPAVLVLYLVFAASAFAADPPPATIKYNQLLDYQRRVDGLKDLTRLKVSTRIGSAHPGVKPTDIKLAAKLESG